MVFDARGEPGAYTGEIAVTKPVMGSGPKEIRFVSPVLETRTGEMLFFLHQEGNRWRVIPPGTGLLGMDPGEEASVIEVLEGSYVGSGRDEEGHR